MFGGIISFLGVHFHPANRVLDCWSAFVEDVLASLFDDVVGDEVDEAERHHADEHEPTDDVRE